MWSPRVIQYVHMVFDNDMSTKISSLRLVGEERGRVVMITRATVIDI